jgi:hypothetical protein
VRKLSGHLQVSFVIRWLPACHNQERMIQRNAIVDDFPAKRFTLQGECKKTLNFALQWTIRAIQIQQSYQRFSGGDLSSARQRTETAPSHLSHR